MATLLTGSGYIGAALLRRLAARGEPVVVLENFFCTPRSDVAAALPSGTCLIEGDVAEARDVARAFDALGPHGEQPHVVFHLAAQPSASVAAKDPELTERSNLVGARRVLEAAHARGARVVFGGSFRVYGDELVGQTIDEHTPYGRVGDLSHLSKVYTEQLARMLEVAFVSVRLGVTYGRSPIMKTSPPFMTVPNLFCQRAARGEVLEVRVDRPMGFIHVQDAADALLRAAETRSPSVWTVVNAAPEVATIGQVARTVQQLIQRRGGAVQIQGAASSEAGFAVHSALADDGFTPQRTLASGLGEVLDLFLANPHQ
ncbi:MAG TPA: NAD(P)-dependent oxidoreductase [Chloroflexota bacterium]|nr:NAD(P)-dependent oxidoreductase [Chloroflexota bacterium]